MNITSPKFYEKCNLEDTEEYMYSIPGFDPCHPVDFSQKLNVKFFMVCGNSPFVGLDVTKESVGYPYKDVIKPIPPATKNTF